MNIEEIDKNFAMSCANDSEFDFYSANDSPIKIDGLPYFEETREFVRIKRELCSNLNDGVKELSAHTSGACARFRTNSDKIAINAILSDSSSMNHMTRVGSAGFDIYANGVFKAIAVSAKQSDIIDCVCCLDLGKKEKDITINFPLYNGVKELYIGLEKNSTISVPKPYSIDKPVLFYGSSITQGGCASRPGNSYTTMIGRWLDVPVINFGFSGSARGELEMAQLIASLDMSCFVMDYDHNAKTIKHLEETHESFFKVIRNAHPQLPVLFLSRVTHAGLPDTIKRREIIYKTYTNAVGNNDKNVYFLDGEEIYANVERDACSVDGSHPNDLGFYQMGKAICPLVEKALKNI